MKATRKYGANGERLVIQDDPSVGPLDEPILSVRLEEPREFLNDVAAALVRALASEKFGIPRSHVTVSQTGVSIKVNRGNGIRGVRSFLYHLATKLPTLEPEAAL